MTAGVSETAQYWALGIFFVGVIGMCAFMLAAPYFLGGRAWGRAKNEPFESGIVSQGGARIRVSAKFYLVAMFFVIFDLEAVFLYAWAISVKQVGWIGYIEVCIFIAVLLLGLAFAAVFSRVQPMVFGETTEKPPALKVKRYA